MKKNKIVGDFFPVNTLRLLGMTPEQYMKMYKKDIRPVNKGAYKLNISIKKSVSTHTEGK